MVIRAHGMVTILFLRMKQFGNFASARKAGRFFVLAAVAVAAGGVRSDDCAVLQVDNDKVLIYETPGQYVFRPAVARARVLVVGGGGAGGTTIGGGGAGGAVVDQEVALVPGRDYVVTVGAGGQLRCGQTLVDVGAGSWNAGGCGGDSSIVGEGVSLVSGGGGGGGGWRDNYLFEQQGQPGVNGGGGCHGAAGADSTGGGYDGGDSNGECPGGGAGAGGDGEDGQGSRAGNGGPGVDSDITGEPVNYGAGGGGGGGNSSNTPGEAGGDSAGAGAAKNAGVVGESGKDGRGGGGGGGGYNASTAGGVGGCGCVVIRFAMLDDSSLNVVSSSDAYGTPNPGYGLVKFDDADVHALVQPTDRVELSPGICAFLTGWKLEAVDLATGENTVVRQCPGSAEAGESKTQCNYRHAGAAVLTWNWEVRALFAVSSVTVGESKFGRTDLDVAFAGVGLEDGSVATVAVRYGMSPTALTRTAEGTIGHIGTVSVQLTELQTGKACYARVSARNTAGETYEGEILSFVQPEVPEDGCDPRIRKMPAGYVQMEKLTSTGEESLLTDWIPNSTSAVEMELGDFVWKNSECVIFGQGYAGSCYLMTVQGGQFKFYGPGSAVNPDSSVQPNTDYLIKTEPTGGGNGHVTVLNRTTGAFVSPELSLAGNGGKFALFSANDGNFKAAFSVYSFKAWKDNIPALDLVPAYKASSDEAGLYDFVNDVFYASGGSKAFARQATLAEPLLEQKGGKLVATVPVLDADQSASLFAGATYGGTNEWGDAIQTVTVPAGETEAAFDLPSGWGETVWYARAKVRDGESAIWTKSLVADDAALPSATLAFAHRTSIVFDGYAGEETLCDFPALVRVGEGSGGFSYAQCVAGGGKDVRFSLADGVELPSEVAAWNPQGESAFWVRLPVLKGRNTRVVMHWGAANPPARELAGSVWSEDYNGVWSFEDEKRALRDSTRRGQHGIASFDSDRSEGVVGKARTFSYNASALGSSGYALAGHAHDDVQFRAKVITWECWYRRTGSLDGKSHVLMKTYANGEYKGARVIIGDSGLASVQYDSTAVSGLPSAALDEWHHVMMSVDGVKVYVYTDGVKTAQGNSFVSQDRWWLNSIRDSSLVFGFTRSIDSSTYPFAGRIDEAKVSRVCRSQDYALAVYSNVAHNASFLTFESASEAPSLTVTGDENLPVADATSPAYGVYPADTAINATAAATCEQGGVRWVREGYTLSADGKEIARGDGGAVQVNWPDGAKDVVVRWHWRRQYAVTVAGDESCTVVPTGTDWYDAGTALAVTAKVEGVERAFYAWRGNCPTLEVFQAGITLPVDRPRSVTAVSGKAFYAEAGVDTLTEAIASVDEYPAVVLAGPGTYTFTHGGGAYVATLDNCIAVRSVGGAEATVVDGEKADDRCLFKLTSAGAFVGGFTFVNQRMKRDYGNNTPFIVLNPGHVGDCRFVDGVIAGCSSSLVDDKAGGWLRNCTFTGCTSQGSSYGQPYLRVRTAQVEGCRFFDNANTDRAGVNVTHEGTGPSAVFRNCVFARNSAMSGLSGGAVLSSSGGAYKRSFVLFENCLFVDNAVKGQGKGGAICSNDGTVNYPGVSLVNCIFDGNTAAGGASFGNDVYGCCSMVNCAGTGIEAENGSLTVAPVFVDRVNDDFHVTGLSPTRDAGAAVEQEMTPGATDLGGGARVVDGRIDIGPYEYEGGDEPFGVNVVPDVAKGTGSLTVTFAVQLAGDTEGVTYDWDFGDGTTSDEAAPRHVYAGGGYFTVRLVVRNGAGETATFTGEKLVKVIPRVCYVRPDCANPVEPYVTPETAAKTLADALSVATDTINIDGTVTISAITEILTPLTICGESQTTSVLAVNPVGNANVFKLTAPGTMLCNLTVKTAELPYSWDTTPVVAGAGTTVSNCVFTGTRLRPLMLTGGTVVDSVFRNFTAGHDSGTAAITVAAGGSVVDRCVITNNAAGRGGWDYGHRSMGVYVGDAYTPATVIRNSLFANNRGVWNGTPNASQKTTNVCATAVYTKGNTLIENCTIASNSTYQSTSGLTAGITVAGAGVEIVNTISWGTVVTNKDVGGVGRVVDVAVADGVECDVRRSCATGLPSENHNVSSDPKFCGAAKGDFRIRSGSPCFNAGELRDGMASEVDLDGNPRVRGRRPDMGCYERPSNFGAMMLVR